MQYRSSATNPKSSVPKSKLGSIFKSCQQSIIYGTMLGLVSIVAADRSARADLTVTRDSGDRFFVDASKSPVLRGNYASYKITNDGTARNNVWVKLDMPAYSVSGNVTRGEFEDGFVQVGAMAAGETKTVFFYIYSGLTPGQGKSIAITDTHKIVVYEGNLCIYWQRPKSQTLTPEWHSSGDFGCL